MAIKVVRTKVSGSEISSEIDLDLPNSLSATRKNRIKDEVGEFLVDTILGRVGAAKSPFEGQSWPGLSKEYKKIKKKEGRGTKANLEFSGDMLDEFEFTRTSKGVKLQIKGKNAPKADGHNNFSGDSSLPTRRFLPKEGDKFIGNVNRDVNSIIAEETSKSKKIKKSDIAEITSKSALNEFLRDEFPDVELQAIKAAILLDEDLREQFEDLLEFF